ncbi:MAG: hypothetical protein H6732_16040 [Alphaproteobacteria bacterium]|nr:hypothetical protein [Alphaproteobacteria bacterium]
MTLLALLALLAAAGAAEPEAPPSAPDPLVSAVASLAKGSWQQAATAATQVLDDAGRADAHASAWRTLGDALDAGGLPYAALTAWLQGVALAPAAVSPSYAKAISRVDDLSEDVWAGGLLGSDLGVPVDGQTRGTLALLKARAAFDEGSWGTVLNLLALVPADHPRVLEADVLRGVSLAQQERYADALGPLASSYEKARALGRDEHYVNTLALNTARTFYASGNYGQAMAFYARVDREDPWWTEALLERAWAHFRVDDPAGTIALLQTHRAPMYGSWYLPEADLLRAQALYLMCKFPETTRTIDAFAARYTPLRDELAATLGSLDAAGAFDDGRAYLAGGSTKLPATILRRLRSDDRFRDALAAVDAGRAELPRLSGAWGERARTALQARLDARVATEGGRVLELARQAKAQLDDMLQGLELTRIDLLTLESQLLGQAAARGEDVDMGGEERVRELRRKGKRVWPFEGEFWLDELGQYVVLARPDCPDTLRRGE